MAKKTASSVKGCKKGGRNRAACKVYRDRCVRERNKARTRARHLKNHPEDIQAQKG